MMIVSPTKSLNPLLTLHDKIRLLLITDVSLFQRLVLRTLCLVILIKDNDMKNLERIWVPLNRRDVIVILKMNLKVRNYVWKFYILYLYTSEN